MIVLVAPYSPPDRGEPSHLGAARKIEAVIGALRRLHRPIVLVNTAHQSTAKSSLAMRRTVIANGEIWEITPATMTNRFLGKLRNLFHIDSVLDAVDRLGRPELVWLYNGYAFESRFGKVAHTRMGCPVVLEMEDWHFSRSRGWNPKPYIDWFFWRGLMPHVAHIFAVNQPLASRFASARCNTTLFPGVVADEVAALQRSHPVFRGEQCILGYFGGLSVEKGANHVAALAAELPSNFKLIVTGSGALEGTFRKLQDVSNGKLEFYGRVGDAHLVELMGRCDVLLNPHSPIESMGDGVFPFKVIEGVASGRLVISTRLPSAGLESVLQGVEYVNHDFGELLQCVVNARETYQKNAEKIMVGAAHAAERFGSSAILTNVSRVFTGACA